MSQEAFDEADRLEESGDLTGAIEAWRQLAVTNPVHNVFLRLGRLERELGNVDAAEAAFQRAVEINDRSWLALNQLGLISIKRCHYLAAVGYLKRACEIKEDPGNYSLLGVALNNVCDDIEAEEAYRHALRLDPNYEEAHFNLGNLLARLGRPAEAIPHYRTAIRLDPEFGPAYRELGLQYMQRDVVEAVVLIRKSIDLDPGNPWAHIYLGSCLAIQKKLDQAEAEYETARPLWPDEAVPLNFLGELYENEHKDLDRAQSYYEQSLQMDTHSYLPFMYLGRIAKKRGQLDRAREYFEIAIALDPTDGRLRSLMAELDGDQ